MNTFNDIGFLADELGTWTAGIQAQFSFELDTAKRINRLGMRMLFDLPAEDMTDAHLVANMCFGRALQSFQTAILLIERGALADARTLIRSCTETVIALAACRADATMPAQLAEDEDRHRSKLANALLESDKSRKTLAPDQVAALEEVVREATARYGETGPRPINWAAKALSAGVGDLYDMAYRTMSGDGAHCSIRSLGRHLSQDADGQDLRFQFQPDKAGIEETLFTACSAILHALSTVTDWFNLTAHHEEMSECVRLWKQMRFDR